MFYNQPSDCGGVGTGYNLEFANGHYFILGPDQKDSTRLQKVSLLLEDRQGKKLGQTRK